MRKLYFSIILFIFFIWFICYHALERGSSSPEQIYLLEKIARYCKPAQPVEKILDESITTYFGMREQPVPNGRYTQTVSEGFETEVLADQFPDMDALNLINPQLIYFLKGH